MAFKKGASAVVIRFESGAIGYHGATSGARVTRISYGFQIQTRKGMLEYDHYYGEIRHFTECVLEKKAPMTDGRSALRSRRVIWALYNAEHNHMLADLRGI